MHSTAFFISQDLHHHKHSNKKNDKNAENKNKKNSQKGNNDDKKEKPTCHAIAMETTIR